MVEISVLFNEVTGSLATNMLYLISNISSLRFPSFLVSFDDCIYMILALVNFYLSEAQTGDQHRNLKENIHFGP